MIAAVPPLAGAQPPAFVSTGPLVTGSRSFSIAVADVNRDGVPDLVYTGFDADAVSVQLGTGSGNFSAATHFATGFFPTALAIADVNRDGRPDLVVANR